LAYYDEFTIFNAIGDAESQGEDAIMSKIIKMVGLTALLALLCACSILPGEPQYEEVQAEFKQYLKTKYDLDIADVKVYLEDRDSEAHDTKEGDFMALAYEKRDPSMSIQLIKRANGEIEDTYSQDIFDLRQEVFGIFEKYKPGNPLNPFLTLYPDFRWGPVLNTNGNSGYSLGIMADHIDIDKELEGNYEMEKEVNAAVERYFQKHPKVKNEGFSVQYMFYEKRDFNLDKLLTEYKKIGYYYTGEGMFGYMLATNHLLGKLKDNEKPKVVFTYYINRETFQNMKSLDEYKQTAYEQWNKYYPNGYKMRY